MIEDMLTQEELETDCADAMEDLQVFLDKHDYLNKSTEASVYVLGQLLHEQINKLDCELEQKGGIITTVLEGLIEFNEAPLAAYRELKRLLLEQKSGTVH